jgi:hypothetical protein
VNLINKTADDDSFVNDEVSAEVQHTQRSKTARGKVSVRP